MDTLSALDEGRLFNATHRFARELIVAGLAYEDAGRLRISELGRQLVRRAHPTADEHHANLDRFATPAVSHEATEDWPPIDRTPNTWWSNYPELPPEPPPAPEVLPPATGPLAWDRARAIRAAGIANAKADIWVDPTWVAAFMDAYEGR